MAVNQRTPEEVADLVRSAWESRSLYLYGNRHVLVPCPDRPNAWDVLWDLGPSKLGSRRAFRRVLTWPEVLLLNQQLAEAGAEQVPAPEGESCALSVLCRAGSCWRDHYTRFICTP